MPNIYLRIPTYVAQFYRGLDSKHLLAENEPYEFCMFQHEYIYLKNQLLLIPEDQQTCSWCYSQRAWNNIMAGRPPMGGSTIIRRDRTQWPTNNEICALIGIKSVKKMEAYEYLCVKIPDEAMFGDEVRRTNGSYSLRQNEAMKFQRMLRDEFKHTILDWIIQERRYCNQVGIHREIGQTIERFFERYYISIGSGKRERESMYKMVRRWLDEAHLLPNDRVDFSATDIHYVTDKERERRTNNDFQSEVKTLERELRNKTASNKQENQRANECKTTS